MRILTSMCLELNLCVILRKSQRDRLCFGLALVHMENASHFHSHNFPLDGPSSKLQKIFLFSTPQGGRLPQRLWWRVRKRQGHSPASSSEQFTELSGTRGEYHKCESRKSESRWKQTVRMSLRRQNPAWSSLWGRCDSPPSFTGQYIQGTVSFLIHPLAKLSFGMSDLPCSRL